MIKHGDAFRRSTTPEYIAWENCCQRCFNKRSPHFIGDQVTMTERWLGDHGYEIFLSDMGRRPGPHHCLRRVDSSGDYEPSNCFWGFRGKTHHIVKSPPSATLEARHHALPI